MHIHNAQALERADVPKWLVLRMEGNGFVTNEFYPRYSYGLTAEDAVDSMYWDGFQPGSVKSFLVIPLDEAETVRARPKQNIIVYSSTYSL